MSDKRQAKHQINSIDYVITNQRVSISESCAQGIYLYGADNNYPNKVKEISKRSSTLVKAKNLFSLFLAGKGFPGATAEDVANGTAIIVNRNGLTAYELLNFCCREKSDVNIAIHVNYNQLGEAVELTPIQYDFVRRKIAVEDEKYDRYIITNIWHLENEYQNSWSYNSKFQEFNEWIQDKKTEISFCALEIFEYNPDPAIVREQIEISGGIDNYSGQIFYMKRTTEIYQDAIYDSVLDDAQFEAAAKLFSLSSVQNQFSVSGFFKYFDHINDSKELSDLNSKLSNTVGPQNAGRIITVGVPTGPDFKMPTGLFEPTQMQNVDKLFHLQKEESKNNIQQCFGFPNALMGRDTEGNFATQKMQEAFDFGNTITEPYRIELENELNTLFRNSIFDGQIKKPIEIERLTYVSYSTKNQEENNEIRAESQARLKGTVGGVQGILQIQQSVSQGLTQYDAGIEILKDIYGYDENQAKKMLGEPIKQFDTDEETVDEETETEEKTTENENTN